MFEVVKMKTFLNIRIRSICVSTAFTTRSESVGSFLFKISDRDMHKLSI